MKYQEWKKVRYELFNQKIDALAEHPRYGWLRKYADDAIIWNEGFGFLQIKAEDFIKRIEQAAPEYIRDWLDGKNELEWAGIKAGKSE